jgi:hypothetical protein
MAAGMGGSDQRRKAQLAKNDVPPVPDPDSIPALDG